MNGCGIYVMKWNNNPYFYIGKSANLKRRENNHILLFRYGINSLKLQEVYDMFGKPIFEVLEYCEESEINELEHSYLTTFQDDFLALNTYFENNLPPFFATHNPSYSISIELTTEELVMFKNYKTKYRLTPQQVIRISHTPCEHCRGTDNITFDKESGEPIKIPKGILCKRNL